MKRLYICDNCADSRKGILKNLEAPKNAAITLRCGICQYCGKRKTLKPYERKGDT